MSLDAVVATRRLRQAVWASLPALTLGSAVPTAAAGLLLLPLAPLLGAPGSTGLLATALILIVGLPVVTALAAALQALCCDVTAGLEPGPASWPRYLAVGWRTGAGTGALTGTAVLSFLVALHWWSSGAGGQRAAAAFCTVAGGMVLGLSLPLLLLAVPVRLLSPGRAAPAAALLVLHLTARRPVPVLGVIALVAIDLVAAAQFSASLLVLLPAPLSLVSTLAARTLLRATPGSVHPLEGRTRSLLDP